MVRGRKFRQLGRFGILGVVDTVVIRGLIATNVTLGLEIIPVILMDIEVVRLDVADDCDMGRLFEVPELEARELVNYDRTGFQAVEDVDSRLADVADEINILMLGL